MDNRFSLKQSDYGAYDLIYDGEVKTRGVEERSVTELNDGRLICGKYKLPENDIHNSSIRTQVHYFIYDSKKSKLYSFSCKQAFFSSYYDKPVVHIMEESYCRIEYFDPDKTPEWSVVCYISDNERLLQDESGILYLENYAYSQDISCPKQLKKDMRFITVSDKEEISKYIWKNINYRLVKYPQSDAFLRECCLRPEENTIKDIREYISNIKYNAVVYEVSVFCDKTKGNTPEKEDYSEYVDYLILQIDSLIKKLEDEEKKHPEIDIAEAESELDDGDESYVISSNYSPVILGEFERFIDILEDELTIDTDMDITYLLFKCVSICRAIFPVKSGLSFPNDKFNVLLRRIIRELDEEDGELGVYLEETEFSSKGIECLADSLLENNTSRDRCDNYFFEYYIDDLSEANDRPYGIFKKEDKTKLSMLLPNDDHHQIPSKDFMDDELPFPLKMPYYGYVIKTDDGILKEIKERVGNIDRNNAEDDIILMKHSEIENVIYEIGYSWRDGKSIIYSDKFELKVFKELEKKFDMREWIWQSREK